MHLLAVDDRPKSLEQEEVTSIARQLATLEMKVTSVLFACIFAGYSTIFVFCDGRRSDVLKALTNELSF